MTIKFAKATASDEGRSAVFAGNETRAAAEAYTARWFFRKRTLCIVGLVAGFLAINALSGAYVDFDFMEAAADIPGGLAWMAVNFLPSAASLEKLPQIMPALLSTVLDSIAAQHHGGAACLCGCGAWVAFGGTRRRGAGFGARYRIAVP